MSKPSMTPKDMEAMKQAGLEYHGARKVFEKMMQEPPATKAEFDEALRNLLAKQKAYFAFGEKFFTNFPGN
jgi:hypothetical protein